MSVKKTAPMGFQFYVLDPYIIAMHHRDLFPQGNGKMGPSEMPLGKNNGADFDMTADWRMYHGNKISGFPVHPHRGFETVTVMVEGFADHFDSKGSKGRYGQGDVQWMTAGAGVQHSEMFPMLNDDKENPMELFQIWLNLPKKSKFAKPDYKMFWHEDIPAVSEKDKNGNAFEVKVIAGEYKGVKSLDPLPDSWAYDRDNHVGIWLITLSPNAEMTIPAVSKTLNRVLYNYEGGSIEVEDKPLEKRFYAELEGDKEIRIVNGNEQTKLLLLEGEPINEPVVTYGPFVMNTQGEIKQAVLDYQNTQFGGWPWDREDPVNPKEQGRFASYNNGERVEYPKKRNKMDERKFVNNEEKSRYELHVGEYIALAEYMIDNENVVYMTHTEVPTALEGQGVASELIKRSLEDIQNKGQKVYPLCPFVIAYIRKHPEWKPLVK